MRHLGAEIRLHMIETCLVQYYFLVASCFGFDTSLHMQCDKSSSKLQMEIRLSYIRILYPTINKELTVKNNNNKNLYHINLDSQTIYDRTEAKITLPSFKRKEHNWWKILPLLYIFYAATVLISKCANSITALFCATAAPAAKKSKTA